MVCRCPWVRRCGLFRGDVYVSGCVLDVFLDVSRFSVLFPPYCSTIFYLERVYVYAGFICFVGEGRLRETIDEFWSASVFVFRGGVGGVIISFRSCGSVFVDRGMCNNPISWVLFVFVNVWSGAVLSFFVQRVFLREVFYVVIIAWYGIQDRSFFVACRLV